MRIFCSSQWGAQAIKQSVMGIYNSKDNTLRRHRVRYQHKGSNLIPVNNKNNKSMLLYVCSVLGTRLSVSHGFSHLILKTIEKGGIITQPLFSWRLWDT